MRGWLPLHRVVEANSAKRVPMTTPQQEFMERMRGWQHGASGLLKVPSGQDGLQAAYDLGYRWGEKNRANRSDQFRVALGYPRLGVEMSKALDECYETLCKLRGVETPCHQCQGTGVRHYSDTSTWRHGTGGQAVTLDVCDQCWGSGDKVRKGADLRKMRAEEDSRIFAKAARLLGGRAGAGIPDCHDAIEALCAELDRLCRPKRRKARPQFWDNVCLALSRTLREMMAASRDRGGP